MVLFVSAKLRIRLRPLSFKVSKNGLKRNDESCWRREAGRESQFEEYSKEISGSEEKRTRPKPEGGVVTEKIRRKQIVLAATENELVKYLLVMENKLYGFIGKMHALHFINLQ